jgi:hypothetical protein
LTFARTLGDFIFFRALRVHFFDQGVNIIAHAFQRFPQELVLSFEVALTILVLLQ